MFRVCVLVFALGGPHNLEVLLKKTLNRELVDYLVNGFTQGFDLGMTRYPKPRPLCKNSREVRSHPDVTQKLVNKEVRKDHILGPFKELLFKNLVYSPLNIGSKAGDEEATDEKKWHLIHDLVYPYDGINSVNACIPEENSSVEYHYIDEVIRIAITIGTGCWSTRINVESTFRQQPMSERMLPYLVFTLNGNIYINASLPFGAASSCLIFEKVAGTLQWIVKNKMGCHWISHFLDDFPLLGKSCPS